MARHGLKDNPESVQAIKDMRARWHDLFNAKKIKELTDQLYAEDAAAVPPDHDVIFGRSAIKDYFQKVADVGDVAFRIGIIEVHADDYTGFVIGNYVFYDRTGAEEVTYEGRTLETFRKEPDGTWKFTVDSWKNLDNAVIEKPLPR
jgi:ketosteroid isomerase-like protein